MTDAKLFDMEDLQSAAQAGFLRGAAWAVKNRANLTETGLLEASDAYRSQFAADFAKAVVQAASADL